MIKKKNYKKTIEQAYRLNKHIDYKKTIEQAYRILLKEMEKKNV